MNKNKWLTTLIVLMALSNAEAQSASDVPRLVVNILVDQLRSDYLEAFMPLYGEGGFKQLMAEGRVYTQAQYDMAYPDRAAAAALLVTGAPAFDNGIVGAQWLDRNTLRPIYSVDDNKFAGYQTTQRTSPQNLAVSTLSDELKVASKGKSLVYAISPFRDASVLTAGHAADGALWIDDVTGNWASSSYYGNYPAWANVAGKSYSATRGITGQWTPYNDLVGNFSYFLSGGMQKPFKHKFEGANKYKDYKTSGLVNEAVMRMAEACLQHTPIGNDNITDYLALTLYAGNFRNKSVNDYPMELQDTYVRIDAALSSLLKNIDKKVGLKNALVVLTSTGTSETPTEDLNQYRIPTGKFDITRASNLLNVYLMAIYGQGQYVEAAFGHQLYLNHKLLEQKNIPLSQVLERSQDFLLQLSGVKDVYTSQRLLQGAWTPGINRIRNAYHPKYSGDILLQITPGWQLINDNFGQNVMVRESYVPFPIIFLGGNLRPQTIDTPVSVDYIAPTLSKALRIRAPNACNKAPLFGNF